MQPSGLGGDLPDTAPEQIQKLGSDGSWLMAFGSSGSGDGQFHNPTDAAVDGDGNIYVVDSGNHRVQKFDSQGTYVAQWGSQGSGNGQFESPAHIAIDGTTVYVTDTGNHRVQKFALDGTYQGQWGVQGSALGELDTPRGIAADGAGRVYVRDGNHRVQCYGTDGAFLFPFGAQGDIAYGFDFTHAGGIALAPDGTLLVADAGNHRIQTFVREPDSLAFHGLFADAETALTIDPETWDGLTAQQDSLDATVRYKLEYGSMTTFRATFTETGTATSVFRATFSVVAPEEPETYVENLYFPGNPSPEQVDTLKWFEEERGPEEGDPTLTETENDSLEFDVDTGAAVLSVLLTNFNGLTEEVDTLTAELMYIPGFGTISLKEVTFTETGATTGLFRATLPLYPDDASAAPTAWCTHVEAGHSTDAGNYTPANVRVRCLPNPEDHKVTLAGHEYAVLEHDGYWYMQQDGAPAHHVRVPKPGTLDTIRILIK